MEENLKKRVYLVLAFVAAVVLMSRVYAHAFSTAGETIAIADPTGDIATSNATATQPDWDSVLTPVSDTGFFRPNATGNETDVSSQYPASGEHWDKVDEEISDDDTTYILSNNSTWVEDLYNIDDHSTQTAAGDINHVEVYMVCRSSANTTQSNAYTHIKTNGVEYNGTSENVSTSYTSYSYQWDNNPQTSSAWTWDEIDALQIGVGLRRPDVNEDTLCTQVYAMVDFDAPLLSGNVSTGDLFVIYPNADYTGDLAVRVYLSNTGNLTKAYNDLSIRLFLEGSVEAGQTPNYRLLTLENGMASFKLEGGSDNHTLSVTGGNYTITSRESQEWEVGWTVTPELYCEVTQR